MKRRFVNIYRNPEDEGKDIIGRHISNSDYDSPVEAYKSMGEADKQQYIETVEIVEP
jgi:hypothetical protein